MFFTRQARAVAFAVLFFFANWGALTKTEMAYSGRAGGYSDDGGGFAIVFWLSIAMYFFHLIMQKMQLGGGFFKEEKRSLWPTEVFILALTLAINYWAFY